MEVILIIIPVGLILTGFVYFNFIFPKKCEKEQNEKDINNK